jgi:hypothetical protein
MRSREQARRASAARKACEDSSTTPAAENEEQDQLLAAVALGKTLMKEVIMALLQRGMSQAASVDQLDLANNHFNAGILWPRQPSDFALEDGDLDGFEPAVTKLKEKGFVSVVGLLDDELGTAVHEECKHKFWDHREAGAMRPAAGAVVNGFESWLPYPPRKGTGPELAHALRILFALPNEFQRHGYPARLKVPTMAHLGCFLPRTGRENLHLDNGVSADGGRELTFVLFCSPNWVQEHGGALRGYMKLDDEDSPGPRPRRCPEKTTEGENVAPSENELPQRDQEQDEEHPRDFDPEVGTCLVFRSRDLWHEMLPASRLQFALTLFVQRAD